MVETSKNIKPLSSAEDCLVLKRQEGAPSRMDVSGGSS